MGHLSETMARMESDEIAASAQTAAAAMHDGDEIDPVPASVTAALNETVPVSTEGLPGIGDMVLYQPRRGSVRRGRNRIAALVTWVHPGTRLLDLAIIYEASDTLDDQKVPEAVGEERGWVLKERAPLMVVGDSELEHKPGAVNWLPPGMTPGQVVVNHAPREIAELTQAVADLRALVLGDYVQPPQSVLAMLDTLDKRLDILAAKPAPKKRGRPKKPKAPKAPNPDEPAGQ